MSLLKFIIIKFKTNRDYFLSTDEIVNWDDSKAKKICNSIQLSGQCEVVFLNDGCLLLPAFTKLGPL